MIVSYIVNIIQKCIYLFATFNTVYLEHYAGLCTTFKTSEPIQLSLVLYPNCGEDLSVTTSALVIIKIK